MKIVLTLMTAVIIATISIGIKEEKSGRKDSKVKLTKVLAFNVFFIMALALIAFVPSVSMAVEEVKNAGISSSNGLGYIAAALSTGLACLGTGIAVGQVGTAAVGAISEDSSILGKTIIILGLAEGIAIYGLVISIMILTNL